MATENAEQYSELLGFMVEPLLGTKEFKVTVTPSDKGVNIALDVPDDLRGRVIGKGGRIANALRAILEGSTFSTGRVYLDIVD